MVILRDVKLTSIAVEGKSLMSYCIPYIIIDVISHPCPICTFSPSLKGAPGNFAGCKACSAFFVIFVSSYMFSRETETDFLEFCFLCKTIYSYKVLNITVCHKSCLDHFQLVYICSLTFTLWLPLRVVTACSYIIWTSTFAILGIMPYLYKHKPDITKIWKR